MVGFNPGEKVLLLVLEKLVSEKSFGFGIGKKFDPGEGENFSH